MSDVIRSHRALRASLPLLASLALVVIFSTVLGTFFQVSLRASGLCTEFIVATLLAYWLYLLLRPLWLFIAVQTLLMALLYLGNGFKIHYFGAPVLPSDLQSLPALLAETRGWRFLLMVLPLLGLPLLFLAGLRWRWQTPVLLLAGTMPVVLASAFAPGSISRGLDGLFQYQPFGAVENFSARGPILYLANEYLRARDVAGRPPSQETVTQALRQTGLPQPLPAPVIKAPRDIYVFMMETFWDPSLLKPVHFSRDPLAPAFRALWRQAGESKVLVPVFGGGTPNSEFEVLCGVPAYTDAIVFVTTLHRPMMCLPRILARLGYRIEAATPDRYGLWNRGEAFRLLGFQRFYEAAAFDETDRNGEFMADAPLFEQIDALLAKEGARGARFLYISTDSGHFPFELDPQRRPALLSSDSKDALLTAYANTVYYDSAELADYIARIRARDPDALILVFGDHLPVLGDGLQAYMLSGFMTRHEQDVTPQMVDSSQSTPLLLIDGRRGPVKLRHMALFELPRVLLALLGVRQPVLADAFAAPPGLHLRPVGARLLQVNDDGDMGFCNADATAGDCGQARLWMERMRDLRSDLLAGSDYTEAALYGAGPAGLASPDAGIRYLYQAPEAQSCDAQVLSWEARSTRLGHGFNQRLHTGESAFLIAYRGHAVRPRVWLGLEELQVKVEGEGRLSATLVGSLPLYLPGEHELTFSCDDDPRRTKLGEFDVGL